MRYTLLIDTISKYLPPEKVAIVEKAYRYAMKAHEGQMRKSGEPYLEHPLQVAITLADLQLDSSALAAALLHDVSEDCGIPLSEIAAEFSPEIAKLVDGVTKLGKLSVQTQGEIEQRGRKTADARQAENLRKMLIAMAEDLRVVFIKLADRLHNMKTLDALSPEKRRSTAQETAEVYAPLAHRLGMWDVKWQLEDLSFRYLEPRTYHNIARLVAGKRAEREKFINEVIETLKGEFSQAGLQVEISGRPKHIFSIYQKIKKYEQMGKDFNDIYDLLAIRVLVNTIPECYNALGIVHGLWHPLPDQFDDYIGNPKPNGYQSLHTIVLCRGIVPLEVQIRTYEMHRVSEYGVASHWRYKEGGSKDSRSADKISWLRQLEDWHGEVSGDEEFVESVKTDIFNDQVFVYTPKGAVRDLPSGATPLDFAYRIHTDLGHRCAGAKVNGRMVPLTYQLKNGDVIEIITGRTDRGPSRDWLNPELGYANTSQARTRIRQWFKKQEKTENVARGQELLDKSMRQLGLPTSERENLARLFKYENMDDFLAAIGYGDVTTHQIAVKLANQQQQQQPRITVRPTPSKQSPSAIIVRGESNMLTQLARCCSPLPGDKIIGYITRSRGVTVHRQDCHNVINEDEKERLVPVEWGNTNTLYPVQIQLLVEDRMGLMRDVTTVVADEKINIKSASANANTNDQGYPSITIAVETTNLAQLSRLMSKLEGIRGVISANRIGDRPYQTESQPSTDTHQSKTASH